ncbi:putative ctl transporter protein [Eutypa lata UCREL1]|uniref:Protein PNS1 n=1 Tax=Eutypa lata (strain UCR-EL1) TaxID=1287681 RepID=M7T077_EUTLA|nr:putative ctl transporter protein [Eutypa lata UCREL1]
MFSESSEAPLFHSALNEFQEEDEDDAREAADLRALQRSRRVFVSSRLEESSASENEHSRASLDQSGEQDSRVYEDRDRPLGIKSSWNGGSSFRDRQSRRKPKDDPVTPETGMNKRQNSDSDENGKMVDVGLESTVIDNEVPEDLLLETPTDTSPPAFQQFKSTRGSSKLGPDRKGSNLEHDGRLQRQTIAEEDEDEDEDEDGEAAVPTPAPPRMAIDILDFSSRILAANPALVLLGFGSLAFVISWTWLWLSMFTRIFLGGYFSKSVSAFVIGTATWWLAIFFFLMYVWTLSVIGGVVRGTTAGTVSNWYYFRNKQPPTPSNIVVKEALTHTTTTVFGTVCASTLLALAVRVPILVLPSRISAIIEFIGWRIAPRPVSVLTNPLALTYAAIHSVPLMESASALSRIHFLATGHTTTLTPSSYSRGGSDQNPSLFPYQMAKMLLHAARFVMSTALGFAAWVMTARQLQVQLPDGAGLRGSAYAYVVGLVASLIGWGVLGAMEGILSGILDGVLICYASERRLGSGRAGYCMEAARLFEDRRAFPRDERDIV